jgi:hypothetical protein
VGNERQLRDGSCEYDRLPLYASSADESKESLNKGAVVLGIVAAVLAIAGDLLISSNGGVAVVLLVLAVVAIVAAVMINRTSAR